MNMSNKEKLQKRFDELCELISEGKLIEHDPKMGMIKDARTIGGALNELKLIEKALDLCENINTQYLLVEETNPSFFRIGTVVECKNLTTNIITRAIICKIVQTHYEQFTSQDFYLDNGGMLLIKS